MINGKSYLNMKKVKIKFFNLKEKIRSIYETNQENPSPITHDLIRGKYLYKANLKKTLSNSEIIIHQVEVLKVKQTELLFQKLIQLVIM
jgi:hypothetical protein